MDLLLKILSAALIAVIGIDTMTHTPLFPMEKKNETERDIIRRVAGQIFNKAAKETPKMRISDCKKENSAYIQPHNFRRYFDFEAPNKTALNSAVISAVCKKINSNHYFFKDFENCNVLIKKNQIEITNKINHKQWFPVMIGNFEVIGERVAGIIALKEKECIETLKKFIAKYGGKSEFKVLNWHEEIKVMNEDFIDKIPIKMKFRNEVVKKLYNEHNVEHSDAAYTAQYLTTRSLEDVTPPILTALSELKKQIAQIKLSPKSRGLNKGIKPSALNNFPKLNVQNKGFATEEFNFLTSKMGDVWRI